MGILGRSESEQIYGIIEVSKCEGGIMKKKADRWWDKLGKPQYGSEMVIRAQPENCEF